MSTRFDEVWLTAPADDESDETGAKDLSEPGWAGVARGLDCLRTAALLVIAWLWLSLAALMVCFDMPYLTLLAGWGFWPAMISAWLLALVGRWLCCAVPADEVTHGLVVGAASAATIVCLFLLARSLAYVLAAPREAPANGPSEGLQVALLLVGIVYLLGEGAFLLFVHRLGVFLSNPPLRWAAVAFALVLTSIVAGIALMGWWLGSDAMAQAVIYWSDDPRVLAFQWGASMSLCLGYVVLMGLARRAVRAGLG